MSLSVDHERRRVLLDDLAMAAGFTVALPGWPDGTRPDVLRLDLEYGALVVGDAKASESPQGDCLERLRHYFGWVAVHVASGRRASVLISHDVEGIDRWRRRLVTLATGAGLAAEVTRVTTFDARDAVAWLGTARESTEILDE